MQTVSLPPRKAAPAAQATSPDIQAGKSGSPSRSTELHSPLSPLSPGSPVHPDGILAPGWFTKHQYQVPSLLISVFTILAAGTVNDSQDERLKADINSIRASITKSGYKTKFATVLISDRSILQAPELEDRLLSIRRATSLDSKSGLFFVPPMSAMETSSFVQSMLNTLQPLCIDYYRDLTKHARRKKTRVTPGSLSLTDSSGAQPLSVSGWNVRYEIKQGVFAEFRQEMETAERHYAAAIDELIGSEGLLDGNSDRSARLQETRALCDCLALRALRCQLWTSSTAKAEQFWSSHKTRIERLNVRLDDSLKSVEWEAWKARWTEIMAGLITYADLAAFRGSEDQPTGSTDSTVQIYAMPEKAMAARERMPPVEHLHHPGYWHRRAVTSLRACRNVLAEALASPPLQSASTLSSHDNDSIRLKVESLIQAAVRQFEGKRQTRMVELTRLDFARDLIKLKKYQDAANILIPLWEDATWRNDDWWDLFGELLKLLNRCAIELKNPEIVLGTTYELLGTQSNVSNDETPNLTSCLDAIQGTERSQVGLKIQDQQKLGPVGLALAFETKETYVGDKIGCQLVLSSLANANTEPLPLSSVVVHFGTSKVVTILHNAAAVPSQSMVAELAATSVEESSVETSTNLSLLPGQRRILNLGLIFQNDQVMALSRIVITIRTEAFSIEHSFTDPDLLGSPSIFVQADEALESKPLVATDTTAVTVLPKPPKVRLQVTGERKEFYIDEEVQLGLEITNGEGSRVDGTVKVLLHHENDTTTSLRWAEEDDHGGAHHRSSQVAESVITKEIMALDPNGTRKVVLGVSAPPVPSKTSLELSFEYTISAEKSKALLRRQTVELNFVAPFEPKFSFGPLLYTQAWPGYFEAKNGLVNAKPGGIPQLWRLGCQLHSSAVERLTLEQVEVVVDNVQGDSVARMRSSDGQGQMALEPRTTSSRSFELYTHKHSLLDAWPTVIAATLGVTWSREGGRSKSFISQVQIPRLTLPVSEPRVLCTVTNDASSDGDSILSYHIENPSTHFLTFALTMEAGEGWGFSGPKHRALSLTPVSRHPVEYRITLYEEDNEEIAEGMWIWPTLLVVDSYYQKTLRVHPAGDNVKVDEKGNIGVWIEAH